MKSKYTAAEFVEAWQQAESTSDVAASFGISRGAAAVRACNYRKHGVPLKRMHGSGGGERVDWKALTALAKQLAPKE